MRISGVCDLYNLHKWELVLSIEDVDYIQTTVMICTRAMFLSLIMEYVISHVSTLKTLVKILMYKVWFSCNYFDNCSKNKVTVCVNTSVTRNILSC